MPVYYGKTTSPRHGFVYDRVPTVVVGRHRRILGGNTSREAYSLAEYGAILDSVFEMAGAIATSNGTPPASAVEQVIQAEGWRLLPRHKRAIVNALQSQTVNIDRRTA